MSDLVSKSKISTKCNIFVRPQPWYFHIVASVILVIHGFTFLVPTDSEADDTDMMRTIGKWLGFDWDWMKPLTPYAQVEKVLVILEKTYTFFIEMSQ